MTATERRKHAAASALEVRLANEQSESTRGRGADRLDVLEAALKLRTIRELGRFDAGQFAAVNRGRG